MFGKTIGFSLPWLTFPLSLYHSMALAFYLFIPDPIVLILQINNKNKKLLDLILSVTKDHLKRNGIGKQLSFLKLPILSLAVVAVRCHRNALHSMVLAQKQKYRSVEQYRKSRDKPTHIWFTLVLIKEARIYYGEKTASSVSGAGKTGQLHVKE